MENQALDLKNRELKNGDLVILADAEGLLNDDVMHIKGDVLQFICCSSDDYAVGCFIHCKSKKRTDIFSDRTLLIKKLN